MDLCGFVNFDIPTKYHFFLTDMSREFEILKFLLV